MRLLTRTPRAGRGSRGARDARDAELHDRAVWQAASLLLDYPGPQTEQVLDDVEALLTGLRGESAGPLRRLAAHLRTEPAVETQTAYVETFDQRRRCSLYLTYFTDGDTRKRGASLLRLKQSYLAAGMQLADTELPDHLCVVLEFAATVDPEAGRRLLLDHRAGIEALRLALSQADSPWADGVLAVCGTLPPLVGDDVAAVQRLIAEGPPAEEVGLKPYGAPAFDALLAEACGSTPSGRASGPTELPMPVMPTRRSAP